MLHHFIVYNNFWKTLQNYSLILFNHISIHKSINRMSYCSTYIQKGLIGRGHYGTVYLIEDRKTSQPFVAKKIQFQGMDKEQQETALKEVKIHKGLKHKNILKFKEYFLENDILIMIMQYCEFGDLSVYIKQRKQENQNFEEPLIINWFVQMLFGLNYLHDNKILHRDIKTQNVFIDSEGTIKLADFGISKILQHTQHLASTVVGTPYYLSPEACTNTGYSFKSDIWSLGCVLYELCTLQHPFSGDNILSLTKKITSQEPKYIPNKYSSQLSTLIKLMLKKSPSQRPTIKQILSTKWISNYLVQFKMENSVKYNESKYNTLNENDNRQFMDSSNSGENDNEFLDLEYERGSVKKTTQIGSGQLKSRKIEQEVISPQKSRVYGMRQKCIQKMGHTLFEQIYNLMKNAKIQNFPESRIQQVLKSRYSKREVEMSLDVAQLLYLEEIQNI